MNNIIISLSDKKDAVQIAKIHQQEINQGFLSQLGIGLLSKLYKAMTVSSNAFAVVAKDNGRVVGFIGGCTNVGKFYRDFLKKYFIQIVFILLPKIFRISTLKKIFETLKYPKQEKEKNLPKAELLTIAVSKEFHGQGIAQKMLEKFAFEMEKRGINVFKVVVGESLSQAIKYYEKMGFEFHSSCSIHGKELSRIYTYKVKPYS